jgi:nicotinate-nucleotide adenylyltransferase
LACAREGAAQLGLSAVVFVPVGRAPHRSLEGDPGGEIRLEMTRLAVAGEEGFSVSAVEVEREGPSYTYETLELFASEHPRNELVFLLGADAAAGLGEWERPERVVELARLGIATRPGVEREDVLRAVDSVGGRGRAEIFEMEEVPVSSTMVRERVREGPPVVDLVPPAVAAFIEQRGLYR